MPIRTPKTKRVVAQPAPAVAAPNVQVPPSNIVINTTAPATEAPVVPAEVPAPAAPQMPYKVGYPALPDGYVYTVQRSEVAAPAAPAPAKLALPKINFSQIATWVLIAILCYAVFNKQAPHPAPSPGPAPSPVVPNDGEETVKAIKELFGTDKAGMKFFSTLAARIATVVEMDGQSANPRLTTTDQLLENFHMDIGRFVSFGNGSVPGLGSFLAAQFAADIKAGVKLDEASRSDAVKKWRYLADAFQKASK